MDEEFKVYIENAIRWAQERLGSPDYPFLCLAFVEDAYEKSNQVEIFGGADAKASADQYEATHNTSLPPTGAFVFYDCFGALQGEYKNWGHVGLCIGENKVIHAWDTVRIDDYLDVQELAPAPGWSQPHYCGWAPIERIFTGYRKTDTGV